jgi:four helix bundle protein
LTKKADRLVEKGENKQDLNTRLSHFAGLVNELLETVPSSPENKTMIEQLTKNISSLTANHAVGSGRSKPDLDKIADISMRDIRETDCWLRIMKRNNKEFNIADLDYLLRESGELKNILGSIIKKSG